jgi:nicotinamidase-related amidase
MAIPRLHADDTLLMVIDIQERLMPTIHGGDDLVATVGVMAEFAQLLEIPTIVTEQYVRGLGRTVAALDAPLGNTHRIEKTRFSGVVPEVLEDLHRHRRPNILICGIEAHVCVLQTTLDLLGAGFVPWLVVDGISGSDRDQIVVAMDRMGRSGAIRTGAMSAIYELLGDASHVRFKEALGLAKRLPRH